METDWLSAIRIGRKLLSREEIAQGVVPNVVRNFAKLEQIFQNVLRHEARYNGHGCWKRGSTYSWSLNLTLVFLHCDNKRRSASETSCLARYNELDVSAHCVLRDSALKPNLVELIAGLVDAHSRLVVVHT